MKPSPPPYARTLPLIFPLYLLTGSFSSIKPFSSNSSISTGSSSSSSSSSSSTTLGAGLNSFCWLLQLEPLLVADPSPFQIKTSQFTRFYVQCRKIAKNLSFPNVRVTCWSESKVISDILSSRTAVLSDNVLCVSTQPPSSSGSITRSCSSQYSI